MKQSFYAVSLAVAALALAGCVDRDAQAQAERTKAIVTDTTVPVQVTMASQADVPVELELTGSLQTDDDVTISAKLGGRLTEVTVREGDAVRAGQIIARQETDDARTALRQAQANTASARTALAQARTQASITPEQTSAAVRRSEAALQQAKINLQKLLNGAREEEKRQAKASVDQAKSEMDTAEKALDRAKRLHAEGAIAEQSLEEAQNRFQTARALYTGSLEAYNLVLDASRPEDIEAAREQVRQAEAQLAADQASKRLDQNLEYQVDAAEAGLNAAIEAENLARLALEDLVIRAPQSGKVSGMPLKAGTFVAPGTPIARLIGVTGVFYEAEVPEKDVAKLVIGMPVAVVVDALGGARLTGQVSTIDPLASDLGRLYGVRVSLEENLGSLKPGMFAEGTVTLSVERGVTLVPNNALLRDGEAVSVYVVEGDTAVQKSVVVRMTAGSMTVVEGLSPGEQVVTAGKSDLIDGSTVRIEEESSDGGGVTRRRTLRGI